MELADARPRSLVAYDLARKLIYHQSTVDPAISPVRSAQARLDDLHEGGKILKTDHEELGLLLMTVDGCDLDTCDQIDELVSAAARTLSVWEEEFPTQKLERLAQLI
jgi:hypothetical protein